MGLTGIGFSHESAPLALREALAFDEESARRFLAGDLSHLPERFLLSTCNRTELFAVGADSEPDPAPLLRGLLCRAKGLDPAAADGAFRVYRGEEAVRHLLRVACGLESMVLGETQILGQVKAAAELSEACGAAGPVLRRALTAAARTAKRARAETAIGEGAVSVASAAVDLATKVFGDLSDRTALVVGAGETGRLVARHLRSAGIGEMRLANRTLGRAQALAAEVAAQPSGLCGVPPAMREADVVICSTSAEKPILTRVEVKAAMRARKDRLLLVLDIAVPRNVEESAGDVEGVLLHDIDALKTIVDRNLEYRRSAVPKVEAMVAEAVASFAAWERGLTVEPLIRDLRQRFDEIRREELEKNLKRVPPEARDAAVRLTESMLNRLLHDPTLRLRQAGQEAGGGRDLAAALRDLFRLPETPEERRE